MVLSSNVFQMPPYSLYSAILLTIVLWGLVKSRALYRGKGAIWDPGVSFINRVNTHVFHAKLAFIKTELDVKMCSPFYKLETMRTHSF